MTRVCCGALSQGCSPLGHGGGAPTHAAAADIVAGINACVFRGLLPAICKSLERVLSVPHSVAGGGSLQIATTVVQSQQVVGHSQQPVQRGPGTSRRDTAQSFQLQMKQPRLLQRTCGRPLPPRGRRALMPEHLPAITAGRGFLKSPQRLSLPTSPPAPPPHPLPQEKCPPPRTVPAVQQLRGIHPLSAAAAA